MECGLVGKSIGYSYSKDIHELLGLYEYSLNSIAPEDFGAFIEKRDYQGLNITIPYKKEVMQYCDEISEMAEEIGAVNTIYFRDGKLIGTNTDYIGFCYMIDEAGISFEGKHVAILGSGGAKETVQYVCKFRNAASTTIVSRSEREDDGDVKYCTYENIPEETQILVNTTPLGTYPNVDATPLDFSGFKNLEGVCDLTYNPAITMFMMQAKEMGIKYAGGLSMLVAQATAAAEFFQEGAKAQEKNAQILTAVDKAKKNIVLIGMPGCGKTTVGKKLAKALGKKFVDSDIVLEEKTGRHPSDIIKNDGEDAFRKIETEIIKEIAKEHGQVIATGGGVVERAENLLPLKQNGTICYLQRELDQLARKGRPLSSGDDAIRKLYERRHPIYTKWADNIVSNSGRFDAALDRLVRRYK